MTAPDDRHWYVIVSGWTDAYRDNFSTLQDPSFERLSGENGRLAKLTSSSFSGLTDYEEVLSEAGRWVHSIAGAMHIRQDPGPLEIVNVVEPNCLALPYAHFGAGYSIAVERRQAVTAAACFVTPSASVLAPILASRKTRNSPRARESKK